MIDIKGYIMYFGKSLWITLFLVILSTSVQAADSQDGVVKLVADKWCPYTCDDSKANKGLLTEVAQQAFATRQMTTKYTPTVWTRALYSVEHGFQDAVMGVDEGFIGNYSVYSGFYIVDETVFVIKRGSGVTLNVGEDLLKYKLGLVAEYTYGQLFERVPAIKDHSNQIKIYTDQGEEKLLSLLLNGRIDISVGNLDVARMYLNKSGRLAETEILRKDLADKVYIAFTKSPRGEMLTREFVKGFQTILKNGTLKSIFDKYDIEMPNYELQTIQE